MTDAKKCQVGPPDWTSAPNDWNWLAQDEDGKWFWYAVPPQPGVAGGVWRSPRLAQKFAGQGEPNAKWYESCRKREAFVGHDRADVGFAPVQRDK